MRKILKANKDFIKYVIYVIFLVLFFEFILKPGHVTSGSMTPTIWTGDIVVFNTVAYMFEEPQINDIISFKHNDETVYCKRIVGVAGDELLFLDGFLYRNGEKVVEQFIPKGMPTESEKVFTVPEGKVFVLGDFRINSWDSRHWDDPYVDVENIIGKEVLIIPKRKIMMDLGIYCDW